MAATDHPPFLNGKQLAKCCKVSIRTTECWRLRKMGPPYRKFCNGAVRYPIEDALAFVQQYTGKTPRLEEIWEE